MSRETAYQNRANSVRRELLINDRPLVQIEREAVERVEVSVDEIFADSSDGTGRVEYDQGTAVVSIYPGRMGLTEGGYQCHLTIYDARAPDGIAWDRFTLVVRDWPEEINQ